MFTEKRLFIMPQAPYSTAGLHKRAYDNFNKAYETWKTVDDKEDMFNM